MSDFDNPPARFFYGLQPSWFGRDRLYRIYVSRTMLAGAYIAGQFYDERAAAVQLQQAAWLFRPLMRRFFAERQQREALYESLDPFGPALLNHDPRNFQIPRAIVFKTRMRRNRSLWTAFNVGVAEFAMFDGKSRRFVLAGEQDPDEVLRILQEFDPTTEVTGKSRPLRHPKPISRRAACFHYLMLAIVLLAFGGFFGFVATVGPAANRGDWPLAIANAFLGIVCLVMAWRKRPKQA